MGVEKSSQKWWRSVDHPQFNLLAMTPLSWGRHVCSIFLPIVIPWLYLNTKLCPQAIYDTLLHSLPRSEATVCLQVYCLCSKSSPYADSDSNHCAHLNILTTWQNTYHKKVRKIVSHPGRKWLAVSLLPRAMFILGRSIKRTGGYLFIILFALLSIYVIESNVNRTSNSEDDLKQRDLRTKETYHFPEKCTTVNGSQAVMVIALALKVDTVKNRDVVRRKWAVIEEKCLYKILLLSKYNGNELVSDSLQGDILWYHGEMSDGKKLLHQWASEMCPHIQAVIIGERITTKSAVIQLTNLIGTGYAKGSYSAITCCVKLKLT